MSTGKRDSFKSQLGALLAMVGSAVGLGNLWRFPYLVGTNGGAAFILVYLIIVVVMCLPVLFSEMALGRRGRSNAVGAFKKLAPGSWWHLSGWMTVICCVMILSFYSVVGAWTVNYLIRSLTFHFVTEDTTVMTQTFQMASMSVWIPLICLVFYLLCNVVILLLGISSGIERFSSAMTPLLFVLVLLMAVNSISLKGAGAGLTFLFKPDFSELTPKMLNAAIGQAFMSLSMGCGCILTFSSYTKSDFNIAKNGSRMAVLDTLFALLAGCAIMPSVFAFGISPEQGPGLVFVTLPSVFAKMTGGKFLAVLFFLVLFLAALTSSMSIFEVIVSCLKEEFSLKRSSAVLITAAIALVLGTLCSLSIGPLSEVRVLGMCIFDLFDFFTANLLIPLGGLCIVIFMGWKLKKEAFVEEMTNRGSLSVRPGILNILFFLIRYVAPVLLVLLILAGLVGLSS